MRINQPTSYPLIEVTGNVAKQYGCVRSNCWFFINLNEQKIRRAKNCDAKKLATQEKLVILHLSAYL